MRPPWIDPPPPGIATPAFAIPWARARRGEPSFLERAGKAGQRLEIHPRRLLGSHDQEEQVGRLAVEGMELHPPAAAADDGRQGGKPRDLPRAHRAPSP